MSTENKQFTDKATPPGYWVDAKGIMTPESIIKDIDKMRDSLVADIIARAVLVNQFLAEFKFSTFADIAAFVDLSAHQYGVNLGGKKGNVILYSYDGRYKIQRAMQDRIAFDERLQAAKALIDECLAEWIQGSGPEIHTLINQAFLTDNEGDINTSAILALRRHDIQDARWLRAMDAIGEAVQIVGSRAYIRIYERIGDTDQYQPIPLSISGV